MTKNKGKRPSQVTVDDFRADPMFPKIERVVADLLVKGNEVTPIDVLVGMGLLKPEHLNDWRFGRVPCLEGVVIANLARLSRLLRILGYYAHDLNLKPSWTAYMRYGKGPEQRLRFSTNGGPGLEKAYATHFIWSGKAPFLALRKTTIQRASEV